MLCFDGTVDIDGRKDVKSKFNNSKGLVILMVTPGAEGAGLNLKAGEHIMRCCHERWPRCLESMMRRLLLNYIKLKKGNGALRGSRAYIHGGTMLNNTARSPCWAGVSPLGLDPSPVPVRSRISAYP